MMYMFLKLKNFFFSKKVDQYYISYSIDGTRIGTAYSMSLDFSRGDIEKTANDTSVNLLKAIAVKHNANYLPKINGINGIGINSIVRLN